jgi:pre-mRNA cleavage complex 2 protein Pcf11
VDESSPEQAASTAKGATANAKKDPKDKYVRVPTDASLHAPCPICQEKFDQNMKWHIEANDFVWMDAVNVNGKIYHATCWDEYSKGAGIPTPSTPDSVLGKRKADAGEPGSGKKIRAF